MTTTTLPEMFEAPTGFPALRLGKEWLEDPEDPVGASRVFVRPEQIEGARVVLFGSGLGYRPLRLRQLKAAAPIVYEPNRDVLEVAQTMMPEAFEGAHCFCDATALLNHLTATTKVGERLVLLSPPGYERAYPEDHGRIVDVLRDAQGFVTMKRNAKGTRNRHVLGSLLRNLGRTAEVGAALSMGKPLEGRPAFLVAAGPSLDRNGALLGEARKRGPVMTVNTAARPTVTHAGGIDVLVSIEALRVADGFRELAGDVGLLALDWSAHPESFEVPVPKVGFGLRHPLLSPVYEALGIAPLGYGASVATAAFALAHAWGADPIVLVGQDLAFTGGKAYAKGTGREGWTVTEHGDVVHVDYDEATLRKFEEGGLARPTKGQPALRVPAWGGGEVLSTYDMALFRRWFEGVAQQLDGARRLVNATEGGAHVEGFEELTLKAILADLPEREALRFPEVAPLEAAKVKAARKELRRRARDLRDAKPGKKRRRALARAPMVRVAARELGLDAREAARFVVEQLT